MSWLPGYPTEGIRTDEQIHSRLRPIPLSRFHDDQAFQDLLLGFELVLPLRKPSYLGDPELSSIIFEHTLGIVGHVADLLNSAATYAIKKGFECITPDIINTNHWGVMNDRDLIGQLR